MGGGPRVGIDRSPFELGSELLELGLLLLRERTKTDHVLFRLASSRIERGLGRRRPRGRGRTRLLHAADIGPCRDQLVEQLVHVRSVASDLVDGRIAGPDGLHRLGAGSGGRVAGRLQLGLEAFEILLVLPLVFGGGPACIRLVGAQLGGQLFDLVGGQGPDPGELLFGLGADPLHRILICGRRGHDPGQLGPHSLELALGLGEPAASVIGFDLGSLATRGDLFHLGPRPDLELVARVPGRVGGGELGLDPLHLVLGPGEITARRFELVRCVVELSRRRRGSVGCRGFGRRARA